MCGIDSRYHFMLRELRFQINEAKFQRDFHSIPCNLTEIKLKEANVIVQSYDLTDEERKEFYEQLVDINENL